MTGERDSASLFGPEHFNPGGSARALLLGALPLDELLQCLRDAELEVLG